MVWNDDYYSVDNINIAFNIPSKSIVAFFTNSNKYFYED